MCVCVCVCVVVFIWLFRLNECNLTESCCGAVASILIGSHLKELALNYNDLHDAGAKLLSEGLQSASCTLEVLR